MYVCMKETVNILLRNINNKQKYNLLFSHRKESEKSKAKGLFMRFCTLAKALKSMQSICGRGRAASTGKASGKFVHMTHTAAATASCKIFPCVAHFHFWYFCAFVYI